MSLFKRVFTWGKSEAHAAMDAVEDPVKMADQGIRELKKDLGESMEGLAKVKAQVIRSRRAVEREKEVAADYEQKAMLLLQKAQSGALEMGEAERLASEALAKREGAVERATAQARDLENLERMAGQLENNVQSLKSQISKWENEAQTLKARAQVGKATRKLNEQLANVDSSGTISMLERMRDKVQEEESLAQAYGEMADVDKSIDSEIDRVLGGSAAAKQSDALMQLKARMGMAEPLALPDSSKAPTS